MAKIEIRSYSKDDFDHLVTFMTDLQQYFSEIDTFQEQIPFATKKDAELYIQQAFKDASDMDGAIYVAEQDAKIVGFIQGVIVKHSDNVMHNLTHVKSTDGWIGLLFTDPAFRNQGVGKRLIEKMKAYFTKKGCNSMRLKVSSNNKLAISVYNKYGFKSRDLEMAVKI